MRLPIHTFHRLRLVGLAVLIAIFAARALPATPEAPVTEIELILDASGSMWNKLEDGRFRIDAAKQVLTEFISETPARPDLRIGLRIYGAKVHYSKPGACEDSELVAPIAPLDRPRLLAAVRNGRAIGATPLARSLDLAARDFHEAGRKQVLICTDGEESCGGDVEAAIARLKALGSDVDVRFIGIGLPAAAAARLGKLAPIENVNSASRLAEAVAAATRTTAGAVAPVAPKSSARPAPATASPPPPAVPKVVVRVIRERQPVVAPEVGVTFRADLRGGDPITLTTAGEEFSGSLRPGSYTATVTPGGREFRGLGVVMDGQNRFTFDITEAPKVKVTPEKSAVLGGTSMKVAYAGAKGTAFQYLVAAPVGSPDAEEPAYVDAPGLEGSAELVMPDAAGDYEIRFTARVSESDGSVICGRSVPVRVTTATATVEAPATTFTGAPVLLKWDGPNRHQDWVGFITRDGTYHDYFTYVYTEGEAHEATIEAPALAGEYEVVYANDNAGTILARRPITVTQPEVKISAPSSAMASGQVPITWTGPGGRQHYLTIVKAEAGPKEYNDYVYVNYFTEGDPRTVKVDAPDATGEFEIRYVSEETGLILARQPIRLTAAVATLDAPATAKISETFPVKFSGPRGKKDQVHLCVAGSAADASPIGYFDTADAEGEGTLSAETAGRYEIRYVNGETGRVLARRPIELK
jgi:Ca-activated chloride channel homolog